MISIDRIDQYYKLLIIKFLSGQSTSPEESELFSWIDADPENATLFLSFRTIWLSTTRNVKSSVFDKEKAWNSISRRVESTADEQENNENKVVKLRPFRRILKIAAFILFVFLSGGISSLLVFRNSFVVSDKNCIVTTPLGSRTHLILPDNSQVWLNAGSILTYPESFNRKKREVKLQGEAFFKVKSNKSKPFIVNTGQIAINALGTSFNVKAYPEDDFISTTLVEGTIHVNGTANEKKFSVTLRPNQNLTIPQVRKNIKPIVANKTEPVRPQNQTTLVRPTVSLSSEIKTVALVSWKDKRWTIQGEPLGSLAVLLERRYNIIIHLNSPLLQEYKFTGIIQNETLEQVLQYLRYTTPLKYEIGKGEVWWDIDQDLARKYSKILKKK